MKNSVNCHGKVMEFYYQISDWNPDYNVRCSTCFMMCVVDRYTEHSMVGLAQQWDQLNQLAMRMQHNLEHQIDAWSVYTPFTLVLNTPEIYLIKSGSLINVQYEYTCL